MSSLFSDGRPHAKRTEPLAAVPHLRGDEVTRAEQGMEAARNPPLGSSRKFDSDLD